MSRTYKDQRKAKAKRNKIKARAAKSVRKQQERYDKVHEIIVKGRDYWSKEKI